MSTIILNSKNCKEYTDEEFQAKLIDTAHKKAKKRISELSKKIKIVGWKTDEGKKLMMEQIEIQQEHREKYGEEAFWDLRLGRKPLSSLKLQNSKGNGYGNI